MHIYTSIFTTHTFVKNKDTIYILYVIFVIITSKVTTPQDAHGGLVLQVYLGSNTLEFSAIHR